MNVWNVMKEFYQNKAIKKLSNVTLVNDDESTNVHNPKSNLIAYVTKQHPTFISE